MNPSPRAIEQAIEALKASPGTFQRLVEEYARIAHPLWFSRLLDPGGRRTDDVTRKGWPDATAELLDGTTALLEATHSESWERHLAEDVRKAEELGRGAAGAFLFAAWARSPDPGDLEPYRQRLLALGIPHAGILFLFRDRLVSELSRPLFGRLWVDPLRLPASCLPFDVIDRVPRLFGPEERADLFAPRRSEYQAGLVYRPRLADTVEERLAHSGWALLRGRGAAGKTTLAVCIALGPAYEGRPVYYLDLTDFEGSESEQGTAIETMATRGDLGVLFIVDSVHLAPAAASRIFAGWQELAGNGSRLLLLGRLVTSEPDIRGRAEPLEDLDREALELAIDVDTLLGVYRRIVARFSGFQRAEDPPPSVAERWLRTFGGDLIAFSTAVAQRIRDLQRGDWELSTRDVQRYIESEYLHILSQPEREGIVRLAALATLELKGPATAVGLGFNSKVLAQGWVLRSERGSSRHVWYRLVHPGLGDLMLAALQQEDSLAILRGIAAENSFAGIMIARRLSLQNRHSEARTILSVIAASPTWYSSSFGTALLPNTVKIFEQYEVLTAEEIDRLLSQEEYQQLVVEDALKTPLSYLPSILSFAQGNLPVLYKSLVQALSEEENLKVLCAAALWTPLDHLGSFLSFAKANLREIYSRITRFLGEDKNIKSIAQTALSSPAEKLASFLALPRGSLDDLHAVLCKHLKDASNRYLLANLVTRSSLKNLNAFLKQKNLAHAVVEVIDPVGWQEWHLQNPRKGVQALPEIGRQLAKLGRPELATALARGVVVAADIPEWNRAWVQLTTLSHTVRLAGDIEVGVLERFLGRIAKPDWLTSRYLWLDPGTLAGALLSLWYQLDSGQFKRFRNPTLLAVVERKISPWTAGEAPSFTDLVSLVGVGGLVGLRRPGAELAWQSDLLLHGAIAERLPSRQDAKLGPLQVQLWLGLRQLAIHRRVPLRLKKEDGHRILQLWRDAVPERERLKRLNSWMLAWLERCAADGWRLLRDETPFK